MQRGEQTSPLPPESAGDEDVLRDEPQDADTNPQGSPLPPDQPGREDIIRPEPER